MKSKIITSLLTIVMALAMITGSTMAYFSDKAKVTGNKFMSGSIKLMVSNGGKYGNNLNGVWSSPVNWLPGGECSSGLSFTNIGNVDALRILFRFKGTGSDELMDKIVVTSIVERFNGVLIANQVQFLAATTGDRDGVLTLHELVSQKWYTLDNISDDGVVLAGGNLKDYGIKFAFKFPEDVDEKSLGLSASFDLDCTATQKTSTDGFLCFHKKE